MGREVITLQFGRCANYVGAHYWNFQDELLGLQERDGPRATASQIDLGTVYRAGETPQGEATYTPRLVLFDLRGSLGGIGSRGTLYLDAGGSYQAPGAHVATWGGRAEVHRAQPVAKSGFMQRLEEEAEGAEEEEGHAGGAALQDQAGPSPLDASARALDAPGGVRYWTDYLKAHLHPRSLHQLEGVWQGVEEFGGWGDGAAYAASSERREEMLEGVRYFAEECDSLQGFQCLVDDLSGWGQLAADVLQEVRDVYGHRPVLLFALRQTAEPGPSLAPADLRRHWLNDALSHAVLSQRCDTYVPLAPPVPPTTLPALRWQPGNLYHTAAILAAAVDTATLPFRLAAGLGSSGGTGGMDLGSLTQLLSTQHPTPLAALSLALPCQALPTDLQQEEQRADMRQEQRGSGGSGEPTTGAGAAAAAPAQPPFTRAMTACLTPGLGFAAAAREAYVESVVLRGPRAATGGPLPLGQAAAALDAALTQEAVRCLRQRTVVGQALPVPLPYPHIFGPAVSVWGEPGATAPRPSTVGVESCPVLTRLAGSAAFQPALQGLLRQFRSAAGVAQGQAALESWGVGWEEVAEACERLAGLAAAYDLEEDY